MSRLPARQLGQEVGHDLRRGWRRGDEQSHLVGALLEVELQEGTTAALLLHKLSNSCRGLRRVAQDEGVPTTLYVPKSIATQRRNLGEPAPVVRC